jgi:hypothetical protein
MGKPGRQKAGMVHYTGIEKAENKEKKQLTAALRLPTPAVQLTRPDDRLKIGSARFYE